jgi:hypothetical protein
VYIDSNKNIHCLWFEYGLNRPPTKRGKEKFQSNGHCQCQKEMDYHLLACQQFLTESHIVTHLANERRSFLNMNDINDIFLAIFLLPSLLFYSVSVNANSMGLKLFFPYEFFSRYVQCN